MDKTKKNNTAKTFIWSNFIAPKYWPSWIGLALLRLIAIFPYKIQLLIGKGIGELFYQLAPYRRSIAATNIKLCFPNKTKKDQDQLVRDHFHSLGMMISETALSWWGSEKKLRKLFKINNIDIVENALNNGTGAIILGAHFTTIDISGRLFTLDNKFAVSFQEMKNKLFNQLTLSGREEIFDQVFGRDEIRATFRYIRKNNLMWIASDQDAQIDNSIFVPFFGHMASTQTVPSRIAKITKAPVIPYLCKRLDNGQGYEINIYPAIENFPGKSEEEDIARTNKILEELINEAPEQYLWVHRRFKTRPEGMASVYPKKN